MQMEQTLFNHYGNRWIVEYRESERLTNISGFLMTADDVSCITISSHLSEDEKQRVREVLHDQLVKLPTGTSGVYLWHLSSGT